MMPMGMGSMAPGGKMAGQFSVPDLPKPKPKAKSKAKAAVKTTGSFKGKSNRLGMGGRAAQLKAKGVPGGVIGALARAAGAALGGPNFHPSGKK